MEVDQTDTGKHWFAMRDLKRSNALMPAYRMLTQAGMKVFTPMTTRLILSNGRQERREIPVMPDLLFVNDSRKNLDPIVAKTPTLQYRFKRGGKQGEPITVPDEEMERFVAAVDYANAPRYYSAEEITGLMCGRRIRMVGGALDGQEGILQTVRGSKTKRLIITLSHLMAVSVEINDEFIELL